MKEACGGAHMKSILAVGELGSMENVYKASFVAMMAVNLLFEWQKKAILYVILFIY